MTEPTEEHKNTILRRLTDEEAKEEADRLTDEEVKTVIEEGRKTLEALEASDNSRAIRSSKLRFS